jgi:hypothetical protein
MLKYFTKLFLIALIALCIPETLLAQAQLIVTLTNNTTETFAVSEIRSIKFGAQSMNLQQNNGTVASWNINEIDNYRFEGVTGLKEVEMGMGKLQVYPNPVQSLTQIVYNSKIRQQIRIELRDVLGRKVQEICNVVHVGEQTYTWQADVPKGLYLLCLISENGQLTQSIVIQ